MTEVALELRLGLLLGLLLDLRLLLQGPLLLGESFRNVELLREEVLNQLVNYSDMSDLLVISSLLGESRQTLNQIK